MPIIAITTTIIFLIACPAHVTAQTVDIVLNAYLRETLANHPDLASMRAMVAAASSRTSMSRGWMNPEIRVGMMNVPQTLKIDEDPMTMLQVGIMQRIPFPGKLRAASQAGDARTRAAEADYEGGVSEMMAMVAMTYYDLAAAVAVRQALEYGRMLTREMMDAAGIMLSSGMGSQADVMRARLEMDRWTLKLIENQSLIDQKRAALAYAIGRDDVVTISDPQLPDVLPPLPDLDATLTSADPEQSPELRGALLRREAAAAELRRARLGYWPDIDLMVALGLRPDLKTTGTDPHTGESVPKLMQQENMITVELSAPLPLFSRGNQGAEIGEMRAMRRSAEETAKRVRLEKIRELRELHAALKQKLEGHALVATGIRPQAEDTWRASVLDYRNDRIPFMNLAEARMAVVMSEMEEIMLRADGWAVYRQWQSALGQTITSSESE